MLNQFKTFQEARQAIVDAELHVFPVYHSYFLGVSCILTKKPFHTKKLIDLGQIGLLHKYNSFVCTQQVLGQLFNFVNPRPP